MSAQKPRWMKQAPIAAADYRAALEGFAVYAKAQKVRPAVIARLQVAMAVAWTAGQDSIKEMENGRSNGSVDTKHERRTRRTCSF